MEHDVVIIGGGAAGLTAGIYAVRAGLDAIVIEKGVAGGLMAEAPSVENYPGFRSIGGMELAQKIAEHSRDYVNILEGVEVISARRDDDMFIINTSNGMIRSRAVIIATGTKHRTLGIDGEERLRGRGVSYCATCDGFFFRGKKVLVIGGGDSAIKEALYLMNIGCDVTVVHRRDKLRAEHAVQEQFFNSGGEVIWNATVSRIVGESFVEGAVINKEGKEEIIKADGIFIAIGEVPQTDIALGLGVHLDDNGYILVDKTQRTNIGYVYAAGDVTGGVRQIVVACAEGAVAALSAYEDLKRV
ncbi:MAG: thioredoxin-disulfide reductase [Thermoplasmata archaeon]|nr:MAG: thioredoxin-disulfide reductase [Thermoplasmata archaeon]